MSRVALALTGQRFGRLLVLGRSGAKIAHEALWLCRCDCGKQRVVRSKSLTRGATRSCGCLRRELSKERFARVMQKRAAYDYEGAIRDVFDKAPRVAAAPAPTGWRDAQDAALDLARALGM